MLSVGPYACRISPSQDIHLDNAMRSHQFGNVYYRHRTVNQLIISGRRYLTTDMLGGPRWTERSHGQGRTYFSKKSTHSRRREGRVAVKAKPPFDVKTFLATVGQGRTVAKYRKNQRVFSQGDLADSVFYIQAGKVKVAVVSDQGRDAVVAIHGKTDFFGEGCLAGQPRRLATVAAITESVIMRLDKAAVVRVLHDEPTFSEMFMSYLLVRNARVEEDLVDQLFN